MSNADDDREVRGISACDPTAYYRHPQARCPRQSGAFARHLGISPTRWNNIERRTPLTLKVAELITERVEGVTIEYIMDGDTKHMPAVLRCKLAALELAVAPQLAL